MESFAAVYKQLNTAQKRAVDAIDGPVLVIAGPGTGKTQLLSARVAKILEVTDVMPQNILCLTFTESGAQNMRERLTQFIGTAAYDVGIGTYHAFGGDLIRRFPEYFTQTRLERPVDELGKRQILSQIVDNLTYRSPLKQTRHHLGDLMNTVSEVKRGLLTPDALRELAASNLQIISTASKDIGTILAPVAKRLPSKIAEAQPLFQDILHTLQTTRSSSLALAHEYETLDTAASRELALALEHAQETGKTTPLTKWKNTWLVKDEDNQFMLAGKLEAERIAELANVLEAYEQALADRGLYDFDDMILRAISALEANNELKYTLQEQYQYLLLDEFQDTNAAQLKLVELLTDNPANEGRPNVLAVGDDDQAIYAFQGAQYSNMRDFWQLYREVTIINLVENYRSTPEILETAKNVAAQITDNLSATFKELNKELVAANKSLPTTTIVRAEYSSEVAERAGVAEQIKALLAQGVSPSEIAVLAPKHRYLEPLVPYLHDVPLRYERRENILEAPVVRQLLTMSKLVLALHDSHITLADSYWPEVLSYDFWQFAVSDIWKLSWQARKEQTTWSELLLTHQLFRPAALLMLGLAGQIETEGLETVLDALIGTSDLATAEDDLPKVRSPLRAYLLERDDATLYQTVTELTVLRARLHEHQLQQTTTLTLRDLLRFVDEYEQAEEQMINTSPYSEAADAVQLMTVFKAKGLEFAHVFLISCQDEVWGSTSRGSGNKLTLPANLAPIRHAGASEDERLRIFFVALTRAKHGLYLTSHAATHAGKKPLRLKYLAEAEQEDGSVVSNTISKKFAAVHVDSHDAPPLEALETNWHSRHTSITPTLRNLLRDRLSTYQLSPTHVTTFIDLEHAGPQSFLLYTLLHFPTVPTPDTVFGTAMHEVMEWLQLETTRNAKTPTAQAATKYFTERLILQPLSPEQVTVQQARGEHALREYLRDPATRFKPNDRPEYNFRQEGVLVDEVHLGGKIDLLQIDSETKEITIVDYKTGAKGNNPAKLHRYELQLYCYKLLVEGSHTFQGYKVKQGSLIFVEPDGADKIVRHTLDFDTQEEMRVKQLLAAIWKRVQNLQLPGVSNYGTTYTAIKQFEQDLIDDKI